MNADDEEILDFVDSDDQVVGTVTRLEAYAPNSKRGNYYLRACSCFIMNSQGKLWVPKRQLNKKILPGALDFSAGGHVSAGESYAESMSRELEEETGIMAVAGTLIEFGKQTPADPGLLYYFQSLYLLRADSVPQYNPEDFSGYEWLTIEELQLRISNGESAKDSIPDALDKLSAYIAEHGSNNERHEEVV